MRRLLVLLSFFALSLGAAFAQDARHLRNDPSYIWAEDAPGLSALDGLVAKLSAVDSGVPEGMWPSYKAAVRSISKFMVLEDGRQLRYMLRSDVQTLVKDRRRKVSELLHHASAESSAGRARTYLGWAEAYLESLPQDPALRAEAARLRKRFGDGPGERVRMRNIESEVALIRRVLPSPGQVEPAVQQVSPTRHRTEGSGEQLSSLSQASPSPARPICDTLLLPAAGLPLPSFASVGSSRGILPFVPQPALEVALEPFVWCLVPRFSYGGSFAAGLLAGVRRERLGAYVSGDTGFGWKKAEYICSSTGDTPFGRIWTSGESSAARMSVCGGIILGLGDYVSVTAGVGYGLSALYWQDTAGRWARVEDMSVQGVRAELGALLSLRPLTFSLSAGTTAFRTLDFAAGVGISF